MRDTDERTILLFRDRERKFRLMKSQEVVMRVTILTLMLAIWFTSTSRAAEPNVGGVTVTPIVLAVNTPTQVTVSVSIPDPTLIANSVRLLRAGSPDGHKADDWTKDHGGKEGSEPATTGQLNEGSKNGDAVERRQQ